MSAGPVRALDAFVTKGSTATGRWQQGGGNRAVETGWQQQVGSSGGNRVAAAVVAAAVVAAAVGTAVAAARAAARTK